MPELHRHRMTDELTQQEIEAFLEKIPELLAMTQALVDKPQVLSTEALKVGAYWALRDTLEIAPRLARRVLELEALVSRIRAANDATGDSGFDCLGIDALETSR